jgi:hypothetical protein
MLFGPGDTWKENLEWAYDKVREIIGLKPTTNIGRRSGLSGAISDRQIGDIEIKLSGMLNDVDLSKLTNKEFETISNVLKQAGQQLEDLQMAGLRQGQLTIKQQNEALAIQRDIRNIVAKLPTKAGGKPDNTLAGDVKTDIPDNVDSRWSKFLRRVGIDEIDMGSFKSGYKPTKAEIERAQKPLGYEEENPDRQVSTLVANAFQNVTNEALAQLAFMDPWANMQKIQISLSNIFDKWLEPAKIAKPIEFKALDEAREKLNKDISDAVDAASSKSDLDVKSLLDESQFAKLNELKADLEAKTAIFYETIGRGFESTDVTGRAYNLRKQAAFFDVEQASLELYAFMEDINRKVPDMVRSKEAREEWKKTSETLKDFANVDFGEELIDFKGSDASVKRLNMLAAELEAAVTNYKSNTVLPEQRQSLALRLDEIKGEVGFEEQLSKSLGNMQEFKKLAFEALNPPMSENSFANLDISKQIDEFEHLLRLQYRINSANVGTPPEIRRKQQESFEIQRKMLIDATRLPVLFSDINNEIGKIGGQDLSEIEYAFSNRRQLEEYRDAVFGVNEALEAIKNPRVKAPLTLEESEKSNFQNLITGRQLEASTRDQNRFGAIQNIAKNLKSIRQVAAIFKDKFGMEIPENIAKSNTKLSEWIKLVVKLEGQMAAMKVAVAKGLDFDAEKFATEIRRITNEIDSLNSIQTPAGIVSVLSNAIEGFDMTAFSRLKEKAGVQAIVKSIEDIDKALASDIATIQTEYGKSFQNLVESRIKKLKELADKLKDAVMKSGALVTSMLSKAGLSSAKDITRASEAQIKSLVEKQVDIGIELRGIEGLDLSSDEGMKTYTEAQMRIASLQKNSEKMVASITRTMSDRLSEGAALLGIEVDYTNIFKVPAVIQRYIVSISDKYRDAIADLNESGSEAALETASRLYEGMQDAIDKVRFVEFFTKLKDDAKAALNEGFENSYERVSNVIGEMELGVEIFARIPDSVRNQLNKEAAALSNLKLAVNLDNLTPELKSILSRATDLTVDPSAILKDFEDAYVKTFGGTSPFKADDIKSVIQENTAASLGNTAALLDHAAILSNRPDVKESTGDFAIAQMSDIRKALETRVSNFETKVEKAAPKALMRSSD